MPEVPATHPGEHLGEILADLNIGVSAFAERIGLDADRINRIVETHQPITADLSSGLQAKNLIAVIPESRPRHLHPEHPKIP